MCYQTLLDLCLAAATCAGIEQCCQIKNLPSSFPSLTSPRIIFPIQPDIFDAATFKRFGESLRESLRTFVSQMFLYVVWMKNTFRDISPARADDMNPRPS